MTTTRLATLAASALALGILAAGLAAAPASAYTGTMTTYPADQLVVAPAEPAEPTYYHVALTRIRFTALNDCDWVGKGDFTLGYSLDGTRHESRFDLGGGETKTLYPSGVSKSWVTASSFPDLRWDWEERDPVYWGAQIGDAPLNETLPLRPQVGPVNLTVEDTERGCHVRVRFTIWTQVITDPGPVD